MITFKQFLLEGGVAGHMAHPFDLPGASTGSGLINIFNKIVKSLKTKPSTVKIDGLNTSIKLITNQEGKKEFAMDRGSNKPEDVEGVTISKLTQRFPQGHGMIETGKIVLQIFNTAIPSIEKDLKKLGMWDNNKLLFNMEYVKGATNVIGYANNFLAIHGLNEVVEVKSPVRGSVSRASREVSYDKKALQGLIEKVKPIAQKYDFDVVNEVAVQLDKPIDFNSALNTEFSVSTDSKTFNKQPLKNWLSKAKNPRAEKITLADGRKISAMSLENYKRITSGIPLNTYLKNQKDYQKAIDGAVFYQATILLGEVIKNAATSPLGTLNTQEGIVIRDNTISPNPLKITGNFIVGKETGKIKQLKKEEEEGVKGFLSNVQRVENKGNYQTNPPFGREGGRTYLTPGVSS